MYKYNDKIDKTHPAQITASVSLFAYILAPGLFRSLSQWLVSPDRE